MRRFASLLGYWLTPRLLFSIAVLAASYDYPVTEIEKNIRLWPVSSPISSWAERVIVAPWNRWDAEHYLKIAERGYRNGDGTTQFHPLYPLIGRAAGILLGGNMLAGLLLVNSICGFLFLLTFESLASFDLPLDTSRRAALLFLNIPNAFILFAPYSEGLFLLCSAMMFLLARRRSWWLAGLAGALAALTRQQGVFLIVPMAWELWESSGRNLRKLLAQWRNLLSLALVPIGLLVWVIYRAVALNNVVFDWYRPQSWIYGLVISRDTHAVIPDQGFDVPWKVLGAALQNPPTRTVIDLVLSSIFVALLACGGAALWRLRRSYFLYACLILTVSFSFCTGGYPYMGLSRHCLLAFPLLIPAANWIRRPIAVSAIMAAGLVGGVTLTFLYGGHIVWVP
jgi:Gpi18-like mannosyltransferase